MKTIFYKVIEKLPLAGLFFVWIYWMHLLITQFGWNVISMFNASNELHWKAFMVVGIACSLLPVFLYHQDQKEKEQEVSLKNEE